jgi:hypothetical protein
MQYLKRDRQYVTGPRKTTDSSNDPVPFYETIAEGVLVSSTGKSPSANCNTKGYVNMDSAMQQTGSGIAPYTEMNASLSSAGEQAGEKNTDTSHYENLFD